MGEHRSRHCFAYGSNMDPGQMRQRCPGARVVGIARLPRHRFLINCRGVATIVAQPSAEVYGILWTITPEDESSLDEYEGVRWGTYSKTLIDVAVGGRAPVSALTYVAGDRTPGSPTPDYIRRVLVAAEQHGLPCHYIEELRSWVPTNDLTSRRSGTNEE